MKAIVLSAKSPIHRPSLQRGFEARNHLTAGVFLKAQTRVAELEGTVARLVATVKEQAAQIQKVSAQLEVSKPAPRTVLNK